MNPNSMVNSNRDDLEIVPEEFDERTNLHKGKTRLDGFMEEMIYSDR